MTGKAHDSLVPSMLTEPLSVTCEWEQSACCVRWYECSAGPPASDSVVSLSGEPPLPENKLWGLDVVVTLGTCELRRRTGFPL